MTQDELLVRYPSFKAAMGEAPEVLRELFEDVPPSLHGELDELLFETAKLFECWSCFGKRIRGQAGFLI